MNRQKYRYKCMTCGTEEMSDVEMSACRACGSDSLSRFDLVSSVEHIAETRPKRRKSPYIRKKPTIEIVIEPEHTPPTPPTPAPSTATAPAFPPREMSFKDRALKIAVPLVKILAPAAIAAAVYGLLKLVL